MLSLYFVHCVFFHTALSFRSFGHISSALSLCKQFICGVHFPGQSWFFECWKAKSWFKMIHRLLTSPGTGVTKGFYIRHLTQKHKKNKHGFCFLKGVGMLRDIRHIRKFRRKDMWHCCCCRAPLWTMVKEYRKFEVMLFSTESVSLQPSVKLR